MRLLLTLTTALTLALAGCAGNADPTDPTTPPDTGATTDGATTAPTAPAGNDDATDVDGEADTQGATDAEVTDDSDDTSSDDTGADDTAAAEDRTAADCSAAGLPAAVDATNLTEMPGARDTAEFLLDAVVRCDEQLLFTAATESETSFFFDSATADEVFALPEADDADPAPWEALARLLHGTTPVVSEDGQTATWPAAFAEGADDAAWQELVDSGLYTQAQVDELRAAPDGYLGYRTAITADGDWLFFTAGD